MCNLNYTHKKVIYVTTMHVKVNIGNSMCTEVAHVAYKARSLQWEAFPVMMMKSLVERSCQLSIPTKRLFSVLCCFECTAKASGRCVSSTSSQISDVHRALLTMCQPTQSNDVLKI
jgi:hypothetical protein